MHAILSKRHKASCPHNDDKHYRRCRCSILIETNINGVQSRKDHEDRELGARTRHGPRTWTGS